MSSFQTRLQKVSRKTALFGSYTQLTFEIQKMKSTKVKILNEVFITVPVVIYTKKNFHLLQALSEKIESLKATGLVSYWYNKALKAASKIETDESPKQLTFEKLSGCFVLLVIGFLISFVSFCCEYFYVKFWKISLTFLRLRAVPH